MTPAEAIGELGKILTDPAILANSRRIANDLADMKALDPLNDALFTRRVRALTADILRAKAAPQTYGRELRHKLAGWRRSKFPPNALDFRLVFRATSDGRLEVLGFGHRYEPVPMYREATARAKRAPKH